MLKKTLTGAGVVVLALLVLWAVIGIQGRGDRQSEVATNPPELAQPDVRSTLDPVAATIETSSRVDATADIPAAAMGIVTGRVLWLPDRAPAVGIGVRVRSSSYHLADGDPPLVVTDDEGRFRIESVALGQCWLELDRSEA